MKRNIFLMADAPPGGSGNPPPKPDAAAPSPTPPPGGEPAPAPKFDDPFKAVTIPPKSPNPPEKKDDKAGDGAPPEKKTAVRKDPVAEQRARIEQQNKELADTKRERDELKQKFEEAQKRGGGDVEAFTKRSQELESEIKTLRGKIAERDYSQHPEFIDKFEKPFQSAAAYGKKIVDSLEVNEPDGNGGTKPRAASWEKDFAPLYQLPRGAARARAKELFGDDAPTVMAEYDKIHQLDEAKSGALKQWSSTADEREQTTRAETLRRAQEATTAFNSAIKDMTEAEPLFKPNPEDPDEVEMFKKSQDVVDTAYLNRAKLSPQEQLVYDAAIYTRARALPLVMHRLAAANAMVKELEERISGKAASRSGATRQPAPPAGIQDPNAEDWKSDFRKTVGAAASI